MPSKTTVIAALLQICTGLVLFTDGASADGAGASCHTVGERTCGRCYAMPAVGGGQSWVAAVDGLECMEIGEGKVWAYYTSFISEELPIVPDGCDDARGQCSEWAGEGGGH